jgi:phage gp45-like
MNEYVFDQRCFGALGLVDAVYDDGVQQTVDVTMHGGMVRTQVPVYQITGLATVPAVGGVVLLLEMGGDPANMVALPPMSAWRFGGLAAGESVLYGADGTRVACRADGTLQILATAKIEMVAPAGTMMTGNLTVSGNVAAMGAASGVITTGSGQTVTVQDGIIVNIM